MSKLGKVLVWKPGIQTSTGQRAALAMLLVSLALPAVAGPFQPVSVRDASIAPPAGGGGDSGLAIVSADGRYFLFASTANNLALTSNSNAIPALVPPSINVFRRDRTNGTTALVSLNLAGTGGGNGDSWPTGISANGRYALFESRASDLVAGDTNKASDVFLRDVQSGTTVLVGAIASSGSGNGPSRGSVLTPDGRYVAFVSAATNLVVGDTNKIADVFVRDLQAGTTTLASAGAVSTNSASPAGGSESPGITPDGRYVVFYSTATNLVPGVKTAGEVYVRDLIAAQTAWVSTNAHAIMQSIIGSSNVVSYNQQISDDGQFVAFEASTNSPFLSPARGVILRHNLQTGLTDIVHTNAYVPWGAFEDIRTLDMTPNGRFIAFVASVGDSSGTNTAIYLWDSQTGTNVLVSADLSNSLPTNAICDSPVVDPTGHYVSFLSSATNLTTNTLAGHQHLYMRNVQAGTTRLAEADTNGIGTGVSPTTVPSLSADAQCLAFEAADGNLAANDRNHDWDVFARNLLADSVVLISAHDPALPSSTPNGLSLLYSSCVSTNGRYVAFASDADNLTPNDTNGFRDVFVRDLVSGTTMLASADTNGFAGSGMSSEPSISGDGRYVAFTSLASNLVAGVDSSSQNIYVRDLQNGTNALVSVHTNAFSPYDGNSTSPMISSGGRYVLFHSKAQDLAPASYTSGTENLFLRDRQAGVTVVLTTGGCSSAAMTPEGRYVAFIGSITAAAQLYVWDSQAAARIYTNTASSLSTVAISSNGQLLAYLSGTSLSLNLADRVAKTNRLISAGPFPTHPGLRFSADAHYLVYATGAAKVAGDTNGTQDVYLYDLQADTNSLVSRLFGSTNAATGAADSPDISADGRFVAYRSFASNSISGDTNSFPDLFLYDRLTGSNTVVSPNQSATGTANNWSLIPWFSGDGQTLVFQSWASDIFTQDFNHASDLLALQVSRDSDGDGMDDQWELDHFGTLSRNGTGDFDGDGASDLFEYQTGTDPTNPASLFRASVAYSGTVGPSPTITWPVAAGKSYRVQFKNAFGDANWQNLSGGVTMIGTNGFAYDLAPSAGQRFYRVVLSN